MCYSAVAILLNIKKTVNETDYFPKHLQEAVFTVAKTAAKYTVVLSELRNAEVTVAVSVFVNMFKLCNSSYC